MPHVRHFRNESCDLLGGGEEVFRVLRTPEVASMRCSVTNLLPLGVKAAFKFGLVLQCCGTASFRRAH